MKAYQVLDKILNLSSLSSIEDKTKTAMDNIYNLMEFNLNELKKLKSQAQDIETYFKKIVQDNRDFTISDIPLYDYIKDKNRFNQFSKKENL